MKTTILINYQWWRTDHAKKKVLESVQKRLDEAAMDKIFRMINDGYVEGELFDAIDGVAYQGWWTVNKQRGGQL